MGEVSQITCDAASLEVLAGILTGVLTWGPAHPYNTSIPQHQHLPQVSHLPQHQHLHLPQHIHLPIQDLHLPGQTMAACHEDRDCSLCRPASLQACRRARHICSSSRSCSSTTLSSTLSTLASLSAHFDTVQTAHSSTSSKQYHCQIACEPIESLVTTLRVGTLSTPAPSLTWTLSKPLQAISLPTCLQAPSSHSFSRFVPVP
jgi:hypothetical protein